MNRISFTITIIAGIFLMTLISFGQNSKVPIKSVPLKTAQAPPSPNVNKISEAEWNEIVKALKAEDWDKTLILVSASLKKLKTDNENKQLARLRYFQLYSLAGKVSKNPAVYNELEKIANSYIGQDFLMPSREIAADCDKKLNYICPVLDTEKVLRVTAINKSATAILSFEYVQLADKFDVIANNGKQVFLGGRLKKIQFNPEKSSDWIMRLYFENGIADIVANPVSSR
jgi:hypothetical protein